MLLLFLAVSSAALGWFALRWPVFTMTEHFTGLWQLIASIRFVYWQDLVRPIGELDSSTWWVVCAVFMIDLLYVVWLRRQRCVPTHYIAGNDRLTLRHCLDASDYEEQLRQRHVALLARYQDPGLVQFLLNREAARAQYLGRWIEVAEPAEPMATVAAATKQNSHESGAPWSVDRTALRIAVNPLGA